MRICPACGARFTNEAAFCPHDGSPTEVPEEAVTTADPLLGQVLDGRYRIENVLGEGGMGVVYRATHEALGKSMAIKVLRGDAAKDPDTVKRFIQEAQAASTIGHPNIVSISDFGHLPDGTAYFVMEHLEGETLTELMRREAPLSPRAAARILRGIGSAMGAAHARGIVHRDLKPDNVFMAQLGESEAVVKILDFGIAKVGGANNKLTRTGMIFGTPHYIAPEQAAGQAVDARTDIYALGVIAYELLTGRVPFEGDTFMGILGKHMFEAPTPPGELAGSARVLEPLVLRALAKKPEERYPNVDALLEDLDARIEASPPGFSGEYAAQGAVMDAAVGAAPQSMATQTSARPTEDIELPTGRGPLYALAAATALVAVAVVVGVVSSFGSSEPAEAIASAPTVAVDASVSQPAPTPAPAPVPDPAPTAPEAAPRVHLESHPAGASVYEDDVLLGNAPVDLPVPTASRLLTLRLSGHADAQVRLSPDGPSSIVVELTSSRRPHPQRANAQTVQPGVEVMAPAMRPAPHMRPRPRHHPTVQSTEVVDPWANN
ncbi:MAG: protein kinase [Deltaproteobacteria bacterium]|nr:protein kinase [Deltaproteobacteria bacterium]